MLRNKILIFFIITLFILGLLCSSVYATEETETSKNIESFNFTGFNGVYYTLPALPEGIGDYYHYVLLKDNNTFKIYCFNEILEITRDDSFLYLDGDNDTTGKLFSSSGIEWTEFGNQGKYSFPLSTTIIYSCQDLLSYKENFDDENFSYPPQVAGTLAPIYQKTRLVGVLQEIMEILPVVLVVIVVLIAMRKALAFLTQILRQS